MKKIIGIISLLIGTVAFASCKASVTTGHEHTYVSFVTEATCSDQGYITYICSTCSDSYIADIPALGHTWTISQTVAAKCTTAGKVDLVCTVCNATKEDILNPQGHDLVHHEAQDPTCEEEGHNAYDTCSRCDYTTLECIDALGHDLVIDAAVAATCEETGLTQGSHCSRCQKVIVAQTVIPALGHDLIHHEALDPTCEEEGHNAYDTCSRCNYTTLECIDALGHDLVIDAAVAATCEETGLTQGSHCSRCQEIIVAQTVIPALEHDLIHHEALDPTCEEDGHNAYDTCTRCEYSTYEVIEALGHDLIHHEALDPTCEEEGHNAYDTCSRCEYSTYEVIEALGHDFDEETGKCSRCELIKSGYLNVSTVEEFTSAVQNQDVTDIVLTQNLIFEDESALDIEKTIHYNNFVVGNYLGVTYFTGGFGTETSPLLVSTPLQFRNSGTSVNGEWIQNRYFKVIADIEVEPYATNDPYGNAIMCGMKYFDCGTVYDVNGHTLTFNVDDGQLFAVVENGSTVKNANIIINGNCTCVFGYIKNATIENVTATGKVTYDGENEGAFIGTVASENTTHTLTMKNIKNNIDIVSFGSAGAYDGVFIGYVKAKSNCIANFVFENCSYGGKAIGHRLAMFIGNPNAYNIKMTITNFENNGNVVALNSNYRANYYYGVPSNCYKYFEINGVKYENPATNDNVPALTDPNQPIGGTGTFIQAQADELSLVLNDDNTFTINPSTNQNVAYYIVSVGTYTTLRLGENQTNGSGRTYATETILVADNMVTTLKKLSFVDLAWASNNPNAVQTTVGDNIVYTLDNTQYYLVDNPYHDGIAGLTFDGEITEPEMINVVGYDANGNPVVSYSLL